MLEIQGREDRNPGSELFSFLLFVSILKMEAATSSDASLLG
jgi:hypothetical protein